MPHALRGIFASLKEEIESYSIEEALLMLSCYFSKAVTLSSSFSNEDQVIMHLIACYDFDISIFTLDTGRLFQQTYATWTNTVNKYHLEIKAYYPEREALEAYVTGRGPDAFYKSVENRKECCYLRKVEPLKRALSGNVIWVTGLRAEHSSDRKNLSVLEWDEGNQIIKYNPLLNWTTEEVTNYIRENNVPYNQLYDHGYVSIGCEPCTRAIEPGEAVRAGRWWWEDAGKKECGLHEMRYR